jgi:hypothetical protein
MDLSSLYLYVHLGVLARKVEKYGDAHTFGILRLRSLQKAQAAPLGMTDL